MLSLSLLQTMAGLRTWESAGDSEGKGQMIDEEKQKEQTAKGSHAYKERGKGPPVFTTGGLLGNKD